MFHVGGSTHSLVFRPATTMTFSSDQDIGADVLLDSVIVRVGVGRYIVCSLLRCGRVLEAVPYVGNVVTASS